MSKGSGKVGTKNKGIKWEKRGRFVATPKTPRQARNGKEGRK